MESNRTNMILASANIPIHILGILAEAINDKLLKKTRRINKQGGFNIMIHSSHLNTWPQNLKSGIGFCDFCIIAIG